VFPSLKTHENLPLSSLRFVVKLPEAFPAVLNSKLHKTGKSGGQPGHWHLAYQLPIENNPMQIFNIALFRFMDIGA
jgi:hypothetical protein